LIEIDRQIWPDIRTHLEKFLVADDVEMEELERLGVIDIEGPQAHKVLHAVSDNAADGLDSWHHAASGELRIANLPRFGGPAFTLLADWSRVAKLTAELSERNAPLDVCDLSPQTLDILRIEHGIARPGADTTAKTLALEARLERAISFSKGCYIGQETIERATARGALKRRLYGLRIHGTGIPQTGAAINLNGKEVGRLSSAARSPALGIIGLAILHHSAWPEGTKVMLSDAVGESPAVVFELPFKDS